MDCVEALFKSINEANGYRTTSGLLVDRSKDPRQLRANWPDEYSTKQRAVTISLNKRTRETSAVAGRTRWRQTYTIMGLITLTQAEDAAGRKLDAIVADVQDDLYKAIRRDFQLVQSAASLGMAPPHILHHQIDEFENDEGANFPDAHFIASGSFLYDEWG